MYPTNSQELLNMIESCLSKQQNLEQHIDEQTVNMNKAQNNIDEISKQLASQQYTLDSLKKELANNTNKSDLNESITKQEVVQKIEEQQKKLDQLIEDYNKTKAYLDTIDDTLDMFEDIITNITRENETILTGLVRLQAEFNAYISSSTKEKIVLTSSLSVVIHNLLVHGVININDYTNNFKTVVNEIIKVYQQNGIDLDLTEEIKSLDGSTFDDDHIAINIPNMQANIEPSEEDSNVISLTELKRMAAEKKYMKHKNPEVKKKKPNPTKNNIIDNISEKLRELKKSNIISINTLSNNSPKDDSNDGSSKSDSSKSNTDNGEED